MPDVIAGFDSLHVAGGRSREPLIRSALEKLNLPTTFSATPEYPGQVVGKRFLKNHGAGAGWLCDLGQTTFKVSSENHRRQFQRDLDQLPIRTDGLDESIPAQRQQLREWLAESLRQFSAKATAPDAILFALPSRLDDMAVPEGSSYIGMAGDGSLLSDAIGMADFAPDYVWALNDAELAAMEALDEPKLQARAKTLVITLGFGLGTALAIRTAAAQPRHA